MSELLPCPFCGAKAEVERTTERFEYSTNGGPDSVMEYGYYVYCTKCDASMGLINVPHNTSEGAVADWNRRADTSPIASPELLEAVKLAYRKHHLGDDSIGWGELSDVLLNALCNAMGSDGYLEWAKPYGGSLDDE